jgi:hypothetical protein
LQQREEEEMIYEVYDDVEGELPDKIQQIPTNEQIQLLLLKALQEQQNAINKTIEEINKNKKEH